MSAFHIGSSSDSPLVSPRKVNDSVYKFDRSNGTPTLQVLFFHGLQFEDSLDAYFRNWESRDRSVIWPEKWLAEDFPTAEILYISYAATVKKGSDLNCRPGLYTVAENLMSDLIQAKVGQIINCSVVMVGHCFGGIVIKELCLHAHKPRNYPSKHQMFLKNIKGIFYYNTPHHGSRTFEEVGDQEHPLWSYFRALSTEGARLDQEFDPLCKSNRWHIGSIGARLPVESGRFQGLLVVEESSARGGNNFTMREADHFGICKPEGKNCSGYYELVRLLETIQSSTLSDRSIDSDKVAKKDESYYMVRGLQVSDYVKRIELLESVKSAVQQRREKQQRQVVVLLGMGGQGKSQLALEYCRTARLSKEFRAIFWIDAFSINSTHRSFERIALKIAHPSTVFGSIEEKIIFVKDTMESWDSHWLLVFDNYDTPSTDFNVAAFFPSSPFGTILVTSRHEDSKRLGKVIPVAKMTEQESLELLFHRSENDLTGENMEMGKSIVAKLQFLPLAIDQAGAFISARKLPLILFLESFELQKEEILKYTPSLTEYRRMLGDDGKEIALNVFTTLELSFQQIPKDETGERLRSFLTIAAFFNCPDIGEDLFRNANDLETVPSWVDAFISEGAWDSLRYRKFLAELSKLSLLNFAIEDTNQCRFYLHPMIADWLRLRVGLDNRRQCTIESSYLLAKLIERTDLSSCGYAFRLYLLAHVDECMNNKRAYLKPIDEDVRFVKGVIDQFGKLFQETSRYREGISLLVETLPIIETAHGKDHALTISIVDNLGILYRAQGKFAEAEEMFKRALAGKEKAFGKDHVLTLFTVGNLGVVYGDQGKLAAKEEMLKRALAGYEKALGNDHAATLMAVHNLGLLYREKGKFAAAEEMLKRALAGHEKALGNNHESTLTTVLNLSCLYRDQGKFAETEEMLQRALAGYEKALGKDHAATLTTVNNLGDLYREKGKFAAAEEMFKRARAGCEQVLGNDHVLTLLSLNNLGKLYLDQGKLAAAEEMLKRALEGYEKALGNDHVSTLTTVLNLGNLYRDQGNLAAAEEMLKRALVGYEMVLGNDHASTLFIVLNLANVYGDQGKLAATEEMLKRALAGYEMALGNDHVLTLNVVNNLGNLYLDQGKSTAAEETLKRALAGYEKALGKDHALTLNTLNNLGILYRHQEKLAAAEEMFEDALAGMEKALGKDHATTLSIVDNLGQLYHYQGKLADAEEMYNRALAGREKALGKDHQITLNTVFRMAKLTEERGDLDGAREMLERAVFGYTNLLGADNLITIDARKHLESISRLQRTIVHTKKGFWKSLRQRLIQQTADHPVGINRRFWHFQSPSIYLIFCCILGFITVILLFD